MGIEIYGWIASLYGFLRLLAGILNKEEIR